MFAILIQSLPRTRISTLALCSFGVGFTIEKSLKLHIFPVCLLPLAILSIAGRHEMGGTA